MEIHKVQFMSTNRAAHFAIVAFAAGLCGAIAGCAQPEPIATLTFEVDRIETPDSADAPIDMERLLEVIRERIEGVGKARALGGDRFSVDVYSQGDDDAGAVDAVRRIVTSGGFLEFRIMASPAFRQHDAIIELAETLPADEIDVVLDDVVVAQWIDCDRIEFPDAEQVQERGLIARESASGPQALMLTNDELDVDGSYLRTVTPDVDEMGNPQVSFTFNDEGAFLFGQLTGEHVPTVTGQEYSLGMILDKVLLSAPTIQSKITDRGRISGGAMTDEDVTFLAAILNAGSLPYNVREVGAAAQDER
jgi:SecD/SecF fusion protein